MIFVSFHQVWILVFVLYALVRCNRCSSFLVHRSSIVSPPTSTSIGIINIGCPYERRTRRKVVSLPLHAKRRRRRKEDESSSSLTPNTTRDTSFTSNSNTISSGRNDLPEFDLFDGKDNDTILPSNDAVPVNTKQMIMTTTLQTKKAPLSLEELLADRSLEQKFEFDVPVESTKTTILPDLLNMDVSSSPLAKGVEKTSYITPADRKRERQAEARRLAAIAAEKERQEQERMALFEKLPGIRDEKGNLSAVKALESGTWACIIALIVWEIYINTPFFERAAPMVPVVY